MSKTSIAIIGVNGYLGSPIVQALESSLFQSKVNFPIKAITRKATKSTKSIEYIVADLDDTDSVAKHLEGVDVIIELVSPSPDLFSKVEKIVIAVKPKLFIPSQFGLDLKKVQEYAPGFVEFKNTQSDNTRAAGVKTVDIVTSLFFLPGDFLYEVVAPVGIDVENNTVVHRGDIDQRFSVTNPKDIANSVASLATAEDYAKLPDLVKIQSTSVSFREVYDRYEKDHNVKLTVSEKYTYDEVDQEFKTKWAKGFLYSDFFYYLHVVLSKGDGKGGYYTDDDNEVVNPGESLWKWSKY